jgi:hypothetical protein
LIFPDLGIPRKEHWDGWGGNRKGVGIMAYRSNLMHKLISKNILMSIFNPATCGGPYVGSKKPGKLRKFHNPSCPYAKRIRPADQVVFSNAAAARYYGYVPCMYCHPV